LRSAGLRLGLERVRKLALPVLSVGSLSAGGAGKTPFVIALTRLLKQEGMYIDVLSRGYGRTGHHAACVNQDGDALTYGDEPLLITREAQVPVYVGARRWEAGKLAETLASSELAAHLLDDGFQHRRLHRDVDIVLVSSEDLADWLLPAGNRREALGALKRATILAVPRDDDAAVTRLRTMGLQQPIWRFRRVMSVPELPGPAVAFCGIARPEQFFDGLRRAGFAIAANRAFPDHHLFTARDVATLTKMVNETGARSFLTTAKDAARLGTLATELERIAPLLTADLTVKFEDEPAVTRWLVSQIRLLR
jgi:tetraacyldisaccharide 4'-kinase